MTSERSLGAVRRIVAATVFAILVPAVYLLTVHRESTAEYWAWTIRPPITALFMAAGYSGGLYFFARSFAGAAWSRVSLGFVGISVFVWAETLATFLHWDRFHHDTLLANTWTIVYVAASIAVPGVILLHRGLGNAPPGKRERIVPLRVRRASAAVGAVVFLVGLALVARPEAFQSSWPWAITPLTGRILGGWFMLPGAIMLAAAREPRWVAWEITLESQAFSILAILGAAAVGWSDLATDRPSTWVFVVGLSLLLVALVLLRSRLGRAAPRGDA